MGLVAAIGTGIGAIGSAIGAGGAALASGLGASGIASGIGAVGSLGAAALTSSAANNAAKDAQNAANKNLAFENQVYGNAQGYLTPDITTGNNAGTALAGLLGTGGNSAAANAAFQNYLGSTNYQFQLGQGEQAITYGNAPAYASSATEKALNNYAQGQAGSALAGYEGLLAGQQGLGVQAGSALNGVGTNIAGQEAAANNSAASAAGAAGLVGANAYGNAFSGLSNIANQALTQSSFGSSTPNFSTNIPTTIGNPPAALDGLV